MEKTIVKPGDHRVLGMHIAKGAKLLTLVLLILITTAVLAASTLAYFRSYTILESVDSFPSKWAVEFYIQKQHEYMYFALDYEDKEIIDNEELYKVLIKGFDSKEDMTYVIEDLAGRSLDNTVLLAYYDDETLQKIVDSYAENDISVSVIKGMIYTESNWNPEKVSVVGARGLMQMKPSTALDILYESRAIELTEQEYNDIMGPKDEQGLVKEERIHDEFLKPLGYDLHNPSVNVVLGVIYFDQLLTRFDGDIRLAVAAYNAGPYAINGEVPDIEETQDYVVKVLNIAELGV